MFLFRYIVISIFVLSISLSAETLTVNTVSDVSDGSCVDGNCSLRDAITLSVSGDTINFNLTGSSTIILSSVLPLVSKELIISGPGPDNLSIDGAGIHQIFDIRSATSVQISGLTLKNAGQGDQGGGAIYSFNTNLDISNCHFLDNKTTTFRGGAIDFLKYYSNPAMLTLSVHDSHFSGNRGLSGGAINTRYTATLEVINSTFVDNRTTGISSYGGAINHVGDDQGDFTVTGSSFVSNYSSGYGGAIYTSPGDTKFTSINNSEFEQSEAQGHGGAIYFNNGNATIGNATFLQNVSNREDGGAIYERDLNQLEITYSTFSHNRANGYGGAIYGFTSNFAISFSTIDHNIATDGGGLAGGAVFTHVTFSENRATNRGGSLYTAGSKLSHVTISDSQAKRGGGLYAYGHQSAHIKNSILANNIATDDANNGDCGASTDITWSTERIVSHGYNIVEKSGSGSATETCVFTEATDLVGTDPNLTPLGLYGGTTKTYAFYSTSAGKDSGICTDVDGNTLTIDQRGVPLPQNVQCDRGAYEFSGDVDGDGLDTFTETYYGSSDSTSNSDGDTLNDFDEVVIYNSQPTSSDSDGDTMNDDVEVITYNTNPSNSDTDGDGIDDATEIGAGSHPNKRTVTTTVDSSTGSLRQAILDIYPGGLIDFDLPSYPETVTLTGGVYVTTKDMTIQGPGANDLTLDANQNSHHFDIRSGNVQISGLSLVNGHHLGYGGSIIVWQDAVATLEALSIHDCSLPQFDNDFNKYGGAIFNWGGLKIIKSAIYDNSADVAGGIANAGELEIINSTVTKNHAYGGGGAIYNDGDLNISHTTISNNTNEASNEGGLLTISGHVDIKNSILSDNMAAGSPADCYVISSYGATMLSHGYNLVENNINCTFSGSGDTTGIDPSLGLFTYYGGQTKTYALQTGSPAIDTGICTNIGNNTVAEDQRGGIRSAPCDKGSYEMGVDTDNDGLDAMAEVYYGTEIDNNDTDNDGLNDGKEVMLHSSLPDNNDTDNDDLSDGDEVNIHGTKPLDNDSDNDGLSDGDEVNIYSTDPLDSDSDNDGVSDGDEVNIYHSDPNNAFDDNDNDGLPDILEPLHNCDPNDPDTDDDGIQDGDDPKPNTRTVVNTNDSGAGSLRQAVLDLYTGGTIDFNITSYPATILLTSGNIVIGKTVTIEGPGEENLTIDSTSRHLDLTTGSDVTISNLSLENGNSTFGGSIRSNGSDLNITQVTFANNTANGDGGAIGFNTGDLNLTKITFTNNSATDWAGAIYTYRSNLKIDMCTFRDNTSSSYGGAISNLDNDSLTVFAIDINNSTFEHNIANTYDGGAIHNYGATLKIYNSTFSQNSAADEAGAINSASGLLYISHSTIAANSTGNANGGGGIYLNNNPAYMISSIIADNTANSVDNDCYSLNGADLNSNGYNLVEVPGNCDFSATGDIVSIDPALAALANNAGPTKTYTIGSVSAAVDSGTCIDNNGGSVDKDQRGATRPNGTACDIGAYEFSGDSDGDGLDVFTETAYGSSDALGDTDSDTLSDSAEVWTHGTDPANKDTDGDEIWDGDEVLFGYLPNDSDSDNDGLSDGEEDVNKDGVKDPTETDPMVADTDGDGLLDGNDPEPLVGNYIVTTTADSGAGSLRQMVLDTPAGETITFDLTYPATIVLQSTMTINKDLQIQGPGAANLTISGNDTVGIFSVSGSGTNVIITNLTMRNGNGVLYGAAINNSDANLSIEGCKFVDNYATHTGGAVYVASGISAIRNSEFIGNSSLYHCGALFNESGASMEIYGSSFYDNFSQYTGGAITNKGNITIHNSTFSNNEITNNPFGGAIYNFGILDISHSTITLNKASSGSGGGLYNNTGGTVRIKNTILSGNTVNGNPADCYNEGISVTSLGDNLVKTWGNCTSDVSDIINSNSGLATLNYYGGLTKTHALVTGSAAIDSGACEDVTGSAIIEDQRSEIRPYNGTCDIGAYETGLDSDTDGLDDTAESTYGTNPNDPDGDSDGLNDGNELLYGTNPNNNDTDSDGLNDFDEVNVYLTSPIIADTDEDGLNDGEEVNTYNTDPFDNDSDNDGLNDGSEVNSHGTNPNASDTDGDGLSDFDELNTYSTNPIVADTDGDGDSDTEEVTSGTDPLDDTSYRLNISIIPSEYLFGTVAGTAEFTVHNNESTPVTLPEAELIRPLYADAAQFTMNASGCYVTLLPDQNCTILIDYVASTNTSLSAGLKVNVEKAFIHNTETIEEEAARRLPPVLDAVTIPETIIADGSSYPLTWSIVGYAEGYKAYIVFFDCSKAPVGECGESYGQAARFEQEFNLDPVSTEAATWSHQGVTATKFNYSYTFTPDPDQFVSGDTPIVIRFYYKSLADHTAGEGGISLIIPGGLSNEYYDTSGRKIQKIIQK